MLREISIMELHTRIMVESISRRVEHYATPNFSSDTINITRDMQFTQFNAIINHCYYAKKSIILSSFGPRDLWHFSWACMWALAEKYYCGFQSYARSLMAHKKLYFKAKLLGLEILDKNLLLILVFIIIKYDI